MKNAAPSHKKIILLRILVVIYKHTVAACPELPVDATSLSNRPSPPRSLRQSSCSYVTIEERLTLEDIFAGGVYPKALFNGRLWRNKFPKLKAGLARGGGCDCAMVEAQIVEALLHSWCVELQTADHEKCLERCGFFFQNMEHAPQFPRIL